MSHYDGAVLAHWRAFRMMRIFDAFIGGGTFLEWEWN